MKKTKILVVAIIVAVVVSLLYLNFFKKEKEKYTTEKVSRGDVIFEISETGAVKKGEEINLSFKNAGRIEKIYVKVGDAVKSGQALVKLESA